jgi:hypothetical protein
MEHSSVERRLRADIEERHKLRNELKKKQSLAAKLTRKLERVGKKRLNNRYSATIERLNIEAAALKRELNGMNVDLQKRIEDEMEYSVSEVQGFEDRYQKEYAEMVEAEGKLKSIEEGTAELDVEEVSEEEESVSREAIVARTRRMLRRERKVVEGIRREISSEERDKIFFTRELRQIKAELESNTDQSMGTSQ